MKSPPFQRNLETVMVRGRRSAETLKSNSQIYLHLQLLPELDWSPGLSLIANLVTSPSFNPCYNAATLMSQIGIIQEMEERKLGGLTRVDVPAYKKMIF